MTWTSIKTEFKSSLHDKTNAKFEVLTVVLLIIQVF